MSEVELWRLWTMVNEKRAKQAAKSKDDEITILARQICANNNNSHSLKANFIAGNRDDMRIMDVAKDAIIAGMELQKGRET